MLGLLVVVTLWCEYSYEAREASGEVAFVGDINSTKYGYQVLESIDEQDPDYVILMGDVCYKGDSTIFETYKATFGDRLRVIVGNHDLRDFCKKAYDKPFSLVDDGVTIIGLNSHGDLKETTGIRKEECRKQHSHTDT